MGGISVVLWCFIYCTESIDLNFYIHFFSVPRWKTEKFSECDGVGCFLPKTFGYSVYRKEAKDHQQKKKSIKSAQFLHQLKYFCLGNLNSILSENHGIREDCRIFRNHLQQVSEVCMFSNHQAAILALKSEKNLML